MTEESLKQVWTIGEQGLFDLIDFDFLVLYCWFLDYKVTL